MDPVHRCLLNDRKFHHYVHTVLGNECPEIPSVGPDLCVSPCAFLQRHHWLNCLTRNIMLVVNGFHPILGCSGVSGSDRKDILHTHNDTEIHTRGIQLATM